MRRRLELAESLLGVRLVAGQDHSHVAALGLLELGDVLLIELLDLILGDALLRRPGQHRLLDAIGDELQLDPLASLFEAEARVLEELVERLLGVELLLLHGLELGVDLRFG